MSDSEIVIKASHISKQFSLGDGLQYHTLRDIVAGIPREILGITPKKAPRNFWALKNVSCDIKKGEVLGLIGKNGSGKSTLLKIFARIVAPTSGQVTINGKVASILEVGTGFHPELTGRENIYLNGAILGMRRSEIKSKFDQIVEFAEIGKFLDTPIKRYSSGMQVRLAFSVACHLDAEVLLIDEVLAVGDQSFQKKSLKKMREITKNEGRTVIFVSHSMQAVSSLCSKVILLNKGRIIDYGDTEEVVSKYITIDDINKNKPQVLSKVRERTGNGKVKIVEFAIRDEQGKATSTLQTGKPYSFAFRYVTDNNAPRKNVDFSFAIRTMYDQNLFLHYTSYTNQLLKKSQPSGEFVFQTPKLPLAAGSYKLSFRCTVNGEEADHVDQAFIIHVVDGDFYQTGKIISQQHSPLFIEGKWKFE